MRGAGGCDQAARFQFGSSASVLTFNYNVMVSLENRLGKTFIMNYVASANTSHSGGQQVFGTNISDFDQFLTLLSQF